MRVNTPNEHDVITTPNAEMTRLATPSRGSRELSTWTVRMAPGTQGPAHSVDREQVWVPLSGTLAVASGDAGASGAEPALVGPGQAAVLPAGEVRRISAGTEPVEALVCMRHGGRATLPETGEARTIPWTE
ncbi:cupin domain-containing protein [Streptomyces hainanensis]|uniref:Cupin domain-containing protein n=1 Tax=Streptomyces hainanensis TaxID=402648 RepID=A0A4R4TM82_9ACTN|nr:cupin domain-containing protein [Streptomyces hainanensis]TDC76203.1 cupin domain-containing protein [Streptomyces hainanensis]